MTGAYQHLHAACGATLSSPTGVSHWDCSLLVAEVDCWRHVHDADRPQHLPQAPELRPGQQLLCPTPGYLTCAAGL